jgi:hypothetical protein
MANMFDDLSKAAPVITDAAGKTKKVSETQPRAYIFLGEADEGHDGKVRNNRDQLYTLVALSGKDQNVFGLSILEKAMDAIETAIRADLTKQGRDFNKERAAILKNKREAEASRKKLREERAQTALKNAKK